MDDLGEKLKSVLSDKDSFAQIMSLAKTLGVKEGQDVQASSDDSGSAHEKNEADNKTRGISTLLDMPQIKNLFTNGSKDRINLLKALKPYLRDEKRAKVDRITNAISTIDTLYAAKDLL